MEASQLLATESFSYSWLSNKKPSLDGLGEPLRASLDSSHEATLKEFQNFDFDIPTSESPPPLVHADELFSNGLIKPVFLNLSRIESEAAASASDSGPVTPVFSSSSGTVSPAVQINCHVLRRWRKSSKHILRKCFGYLRPLWKKVEGSRKCTRVNDIDRKAWEVKSWTNSTQASPQRSIVYSTGDDWCDMECSIYEAVLHCKRSIEK